MSTFIPASQERVILEGAVTQLARAISRAKADGDPLNDVAGMESLITGIEKRLAAMEDVSAS